MSSILSNDNEYISIDHPGFGDFLVIKSDRLEYFIDLINSKEIKSIGISPNKGYKLNEVNFLKDCPGVEKVYIVGDEFELTGLNSLKQLTFISTLSNIETVDFANFPNLIYCCINWYKAIVNLEKCENLLHLRLYKYKSPQNNLLHLPLFAKLQILELVSSSITSLDGIERCRALVNLEGYYLSKLEDIKAVAAIKSLSSLILENCKKIKSYNELSANKELRKLILSNCGDIASIGFIRELKELNFFTFIGSNIVDGDMTPCIGLKYFAFTNKRNYSHTMEEIRTIAEGDDDGLHKR